MLEPVNMNFEMVECNDDSNLVEVRRRGHQWAVEVNVERVQRMSEEDIRFMFSAMKDAVKRSRESFESPTQLPA